MKTNKIGSLGILDSPALAMKGESALKLFLFHALVVLVFFAEVKADPTFSRSTYFSAQENKQLKGYVVKRFHSPSLLSCSQQCVKNAWCISTNYKMSSKKDSKGTCELNKHDISLVIENANLHDQKGVTFSMLLKDIKQNKGSGEIPSETITAIFTCDNEMEMFANGVSLGKDNYWKSPTNYVIPGNTRVISVKGIDKGGFFEILGSLSNGMVTNASWKCDKNKYPGWNSPDFDDSNWPASGEVAKHGDPPKGIITGIGSTAKWIWTTRHPDNVYCRLRLQ